MQCESFVQTLIEGWKETRQFTYDFLNEVSLDALNQKLPRPGLDTLAKHIYEMALVQKAFTKVIEGMALDFSSVEAITFGHEDYVARSKEALRSALEEADRYLSKVISATEKWGEDVEIFGEILPKYSVLELMIRHETLHHGQFVAFGYLLKIPFPQSWIDSWALPTDEAV